MPRRYVDYLPTDTFTTLNTISTIGSFILGASTIPFLYNVVRSWKHGQLALRDDPWGHGNSLEWATSSPPPRHNFVEIPRIRSERPAFEAHYPHLQQRLQDEAHAGKRHEPYAERARRWHRAAAGSERPRPDLRQPDPSHASRPAGPSAVPGRRGVVRGVRHDDGGAAGPHPPCAGVPDRAGRPRAAHRHRRGPPRRHRARCSPRWPRAAPAVEVLDVEQVVVHGQLVLGVVVARCWRPTVQRRTTPRCWPADGRSPRPSPPTPACGCTVESASDPAPGRTAPARAARTT